MPNRLIEQCGPDARAHSTRLKQDARRKADPQTTTDRLTVEHAIALVTNSSAGTRH
jgi:hypothetical protein